MVQKPLTLMISVKTGRLCCYGNRRGWSSCSQRSLHSNCNLIHLLLCQQKITVECGNDCLLTKELRGIRQVKDRRSGNRPASSCQWMSDFEEEKREHLLTYFCSLWSSSGPVTPLNSCVEASTFHNTTLTAGVVLWGRRHLRKTRHGGLTVCPNWKSKREKNDPSWIMVCAQQPPAWHTQNSWNEEVLP